MFKRRLVNSVTAAALLSVPMSVTLPTAGWSAIDEIVVTTRKREENLQDLPLAVTAIGFETLQRQGTSSLEDITKFSPSFIFDNNSAQKDVRVAVRGLSATRGRSSVAFLVDGIDVTSEAIGTAGASIMTSTRLLGDLQRVEAVKGPQSALYGRAAFAGAINYVTKDAPDEFEGYVSAEAAEWGEYSVSGSVGGPITDTLGMSATGFYWDEEGQYETVNSGAPLGGGEGFGGALTINYDPTDSIRIKTRLEYTDEQWNDQPRTRFEPDTILDTPAEAALILEEPDETPLPAGGLTGTADVISSYGDASNGSPLLRSEDPRDGSELDGVEQQMFRASLVASWDIDAIKGTITSYTGYSDSEISEQYDWDGFAIGRPDTNVGTQIIDNGTDTEIFSQEIRYQSDWDGSIQLTLGANYWSQERVFQENGLLGNALGNGFGGDFASWQDLFNSNIDLGYNERDPRTIKDKHQSIYGMLEWDITEQFKATFEGRYSEDDFWQEMTAFDLPFGGGQFVASGACSLDDINVFADTCIHPDSIFGGFLYKGERLSFKPTAHSNAFTPKITLEWSPNDDIMTYFSVADASKPAGMDVLGGGSPAASVDDYIDTFTFKPEKMRAYELGAKTAWSGGFGDLTLNGSVFFQDYSDKQVSLRLIAPDGTVARRTVNAGAAEVYGLELETTWQTPIEGLNLSAAYTYLDTEYVEFTDNATDSDGIAKVGNCIPVDNSGNGIPDACQTSRAGNQLERAPEHAFVAQAAYSRPLANSDMSWFVEGDTQYQGERFVDTENNQLFDDYWLLNLRAGLEGDNWEAMIFLDNVTGDDTIRNGSQIPDFATPNPDLSPVGSLRGSPEFIDVGNLPPKRQVGVRAKYKF